MIKLNLAENSKSYLDNAHIYDEFSKAQDKSDQIGTFLESQIKNKVVLDVGCGTGKYVLRLLKYALNYYGFDISQNQIDIAQSKIIDESSVKLFCSSAQNIPLKPKY